MTEQILVAAIGGFLVVQAVALVISAYHSLVIVVGSLLSPRRSGSGETQPTVRFGLMIPARNEERVIRDLIADLRAQAYPQDLVTILVVAHDCSDRTAAVARECGAAAVELRAPGGGKAAAMKKGIEWFGNSVDLVGVFDADVRVDPGVLREVSSLPAGDAAVQLETAFSSGLEGVALEHAVARRGRALLRWRPRSRIGLSVVFNAGGYFVRPEVLVPLMHGLRTMTEDLELTARLVASGRRVAYLEGPWLAVEEPARIRTAIQQRVRWARGHLGVVRWEIPRLLAAGFRGHLAALDMVTYLLVPTRTLTRLVLSAVLVVAVSTPLATVPVWALVIALVGEWLLPAAVALRAGLVPLRLRAVATVAGVTGLSLLWFPVGLLALVTFRRRSWRQVPRRSGGAGQTERAD